MPRRRGLLRDLADVGDVPGRQRRGLVSEGATPLLVGVASIASCGPGTFGWFGNVGAPEILRFIQGDDNPPVAPREVGEPALAYPLPPYARAWMDLLPGKWSGSPVFRYEFKNEPGSSCRSLPHRGIGCGRATSHTG